MNDKHGPESRGAASTRRSWSWYGAAGVVLIAAASVLYFAVWSGGETGEAPKGRATATVAGAVLAANTTGSSPASPDGSSVEFRDVTRQAGIDFQHTNGRAGKLFVIEVKGSGTGLVDYDNDGDLDLYAVNGNNLPGAKTETPPTNRLYRNEGDGTFSDVTEMAGVGDTGYGHGVAAADYDNDGDQDLYVLNYGPNVLYRNNGDGTFADVTAQAGVAGNVWSASAVFCDVNNDGWLDLYVANYLVFDIERNIGLPTGPGFYDGEVDVLYLSNGDGTFRDVTQENVGNPNGKGLGVVCFDYDEDGDMEIYVANDSTPNLMYENQGNGVFKDVTLYSGTGVNRAGEAESGMGVDAGDYDNDGDLDVFVTNYKGESNTLYRNEGQGVFTDVTSRANLVAASLPYVTFGTGFFDYDNNGDLDIYVANGHTEEELADHEQPDQLFRNMGNGRFEDVSASAGAPFSRKFVGRGVAFGDYDNDGDVDLVVSNKNGPLNLLQNVGGNERSWLAIRTIGTRSNRDGIGARIKVAAPGFERVKDVRTGYSIFSSNDPRVYFGLGDRDRVDVEIRWPSGVVDKLEAVPARSLLTVTEGTGEGVISELRRIAADYGEQTQETTVQVLDDPAEIEAEVARLRSSIDEESANLDDYLDHGEALLAWIGLRVEALFAAMIQSTPGEPEYRIELGNYLSAKLRFDEALEMYREAARIDPESVDAHSRIATLALRFGKYEESVTSSSRARELGERTAAADLRYARALAGLGRTAEAVAALREMTDRAPSYVEAYLELANVHADAGEAGKSLEASRTAVRLAPADAVGRYQLAEAYRRVGDSARYDEELALFEMLDRESTVFYGGLTDQSEIDLLLREVRMNPLFGQVRAGRQLSLRYAEIGDLEGRDLHNARARAAELKDALSGDVNAIRRIQEMYPVPAAKEFYEDLNLLRLRLNWAMNLALGYDPAEAGRHVARGRELSAAAAYDDALDAYRAALQHYPDSVEALHGIVGVHLASRFRLEFAEEIARRTVAMDQSPESNEILARVHRAMGKASKSDDGSAEVSE